MRLTIEFELEHLEGNTCEPDEVYHSLTSEVDIRTFYPLDDDGRSSAYDIVGMRLVGASS